MSAKRRRYHRNSSGKPKHGRQILQRELEERGWTVEMRKTLLPPAGRVNVPDGKGGAISERFWWERDVLAVEGSELFQKRINEEKSKQRRREKQIEDFKQRMAELTVASSPRDEYPLARGMKRRFILHVGPTNSGKTHDALERLKTAASGIYLGPLRLLALEIYDRFKAENIPCNMVTGEESIFEEDAGITACTVEMLETDKMYDVAVLDEAQMMADPFRGHQWTRALLGICADEIHVCLAPEAEEIVRRLIAECGDEVEIVRHKRMTPLKWQDTPFRLRDVQPGDALIVFSRRAVLELAAALENNRIRVSVIYGDLPPASRREQVRRFMAGETQVVVSTDAIGMGINLAIRRIVFVDTKKFDGVEFRSLRPGEIQQIAGRAGRYGIFPEGVVAAMQDNEWIRDGLNAPIVPIEKAYLGFPEILLNIPSPLRHILTDWSDVKTEGHYQKMDVGERMLLHDMLRENDKVSFSVLDKETLYRMITCSVNLKNERMVAEWVSYCGEYLRSKKLTPPTPFYGHDLQKAEAEYHCLELYYQFGRRMHREIDNAYLERRRRELEYEIDEQLSKGKRTFARKCEMCGSVLPFAGKQRLCRACFKKTYSPDAAFAAYIDSENHTGNGGKERNPK